MHDGPPGVKARKIISEILISTNVTPSEIIEETVNRLNKSKPPAKIEYKKDGQFYRVIRRIYETETAENSY